MTSPGVQQHGIGLMPFMKWAVRIPNPTRRLGATSTEKDRGIKTVRGPEVIKENPRAIQEFLDSCPHFACLMPLTLGLQPSVACVREQNPTLLYSFSLTGSEGTRRDMPERTNRLRGVLWMVAAELCWSTGGILVRSVRVTDAWEVVFWRALFMAAFIGVFLTIRHRHRAMA